MNQTPIAPYNSTAWETGATIVTGPGFLRSLLVTNKAAVKRFIFVYRALSATGVPMFAPIKLESEASFLFPFDPAMPEFTLGCHVAASQTLDAFLATGAADLWITAVFAPQFTPVTHQRRVR